MLRVSHVITGLGIGGAEVMLVKLLGAIGRDRFQSHVISLSAEVPLAGDIRKLGIEVDVVEAPASVTGAWSTLTGVTRLLRRAKPDLVQTWLYHADLVGGLTARRLGVPVLWNVQSSTLDPSGIRARTLRVVKACALVSRFVPRAIVSCSHVAVGIHQDIGYRATFRVIPNGTDLDIFRPDADARREMRAEFGLDDSTPVIGMVARFHPMKDHPNFLAAAAKLAATHPHVRFLLCGLDLDPSNKLLANLIRDYQLERHVVLMGMRRDVSRVLNAFDIHSLSSAYGEGFPNVLGEAMATGLPCVVTTIGDSALIVGETGVSVPPRDPEALAAGWRTLLDLPPEAFQRLRVSARERIAAQFSLAASVAQYEALYEETARR
jgi:glycosyltransferase involved in cell wall biosynthesis